MVNSPATIESALRLARNAIDAVDARVILQHTLSTGRAHLAAHPERELTPMQQEQFLAFVERRKSGEPVAYIVGEREFFGLSFKVTPAVLIPRPETEMLVEQALARLPRHLPADILELGTGSGAIAIAIAQHRSLARIVATDVSQPALQIAMQNAQMILRERSAAIQFLQGDWFDAVPMGSFDLIVSNPPYIAENDAHLNQGDLRFEPKNALAAGPRGLSALAHITRNAAPRLAPGGWLLFEHGYDQAQACAELLIQADFIHITTYRDLADLDRVTLGQRPDEQ